MITVRFHNGQAIQYNGGNYVIRTDAYIDIYTAKNGQWIAQVPTSMCVVEIVDPCRVYDGLKREPDAATAKELAALRRKLNRICKKLNMGV
jgi:hypothetical protein